MVTLPIHGGIEDETRGKKGIDFDFFFLFCFRRRVYRCVISRMVRHLSRDVRTSSSRYITRGCIASACVFSLFSLPIPRVFPRLYELTPRSYTMNRVLECGIISNLSSSRESYVLFVNSSRRDKSFLPRKIATVRIDGESST